MSLSVHGALTQPRPISRREGTHVPGATASKTRHDQNAHGEALADDDDCQSVVQPSGHERDLLDGREVIMGSLSES